MPVGRSLDLCHGGRATSRLVIWVTDDARRMPVLMKSKVLIGSISVVLQEAKPGTG